MKKVISMLIASAIALSLAVPVFAADTFTDVNENHYGWAYQHVEDMAEKGLISGFGDGTYRPQNPISRMDGFALFARLMGSNNPTNQATLDYAKAKYADVLKKYELTYAEGDISYMLYRGAITEEELDVYFAGEKKLEAMPRHEAAVLITKAMLGEEDAKAEVLIDMDYSDVADIPKAARQYVYYVTQKGIMGGVGNGQFAPNTTVDRGQIAVMLSKTADSANYFSETAALLSIDVKTKNITIRDGQNNKFEIGYNADTKFYLDGKPAKDTDFNAGQTVTLTYTNDDDKVVLSFADGVTNEPQEYVPVIYEGYSSNSGKLMLMTRDAATGVDKSYEASVHAVVTIDGDISDINKLSEGEYVNLGIADGVVVSIESMQKKVVIENATLKSINAMGSITIEHADDEFNGQTYAVASDARITKNGNTAEYTSLYRGDELEITLEYGLISKIVAKAKVRTETGILKAYTISANPTITIRSSGEDYTYDIPAGIVITIDGKTAKLAEFEIGNSVKVTIESDAVTKLEADAAAGTTTGSMVSGQVSAVNESTRAIIVVYDEAGAESTAYINCTEGTEYRKVPNLDICKLKDISVGDTITAYGSYSNGIFIATGIIVTPSVQ